MESNLSDIMKNALDNLRSAADGDTVIGNPITTPAGVMIIPVSRVSMGFASGGLDSAGKEAADKMRKGKSFGGGGGSGLSVTPVAFLVIRPDGEVSLLNLSQKAEAGGHSNPIDSVTNLLEKSPDIINRLKTVFKKSKPAQEPREEDTEDQIIL